MVRYLFGIKKQGFGEGIRSVQIQKTLQKYYEDGEDFQYFGVDDDDSSTRNTSRSSMILGSY